MMSSEKIKKMNVIQAAGGLVWRHTLNGREIALIHRPQFDDWTLPKGWLKDSETWQEAALREVKEETECEVTLGEFAGCTCYIVHGVPKVVLFWHMDVTEEGRFESGEEVDELLWLPIDEALDKLSYSGQKILLKRNRGAHM
jgi:ADP-ribose pyrophosphatase YjhB (NUDIX family)